MSNALLSFKAGKALADEFSIRVNQNVTWNGKSLETWRREFTIAFPKVPDIHNVRAAKADIAIKYQEACWYKTQVQAALGLYQSHRDKSYKVAFVKQVNSFKSEDKKLPSHETIKSLVEQELLEIDDGLAVQEMVLEFWKTVIDSLSNMRKLAESITLDLSVEAKLNREIPNGSE